MGDAKSGRYSDAVIAIPNRKAGDFRIGTNRWIDVDHGSTTTVDDRTVDELELPRGAKFGGQCDGLPRQDQVLDIDAGRDEDDVSVASGIDARLNHGLIQRNPDDSGGPADARDRR